MQAEPRAISKLKRHLFLRNGVWWTRIVRNGQDERKSTECPKPEVVASRTIRDQRLAEVATRRAGVERPAEPSLLGELIAAYLAEESNPYDREKGGEQPGTKRTADCDRASVVRVKRHLPTDRSAALVDREALLELAKKIEREEPTPASGTRRKTSVPRSPFAELTRSDRARLFPRARKRGYLYSPDELLAIYRTLPAHLVPFVRFAVHTGMRLNEITTLPLGSRGPQAQGCGRRGPFCEEQARAGGRPRSGRHGDSGSSKAGVSFTTGCVFIGLRGEPIKDVRGGFNRAVLEVWKPSRPGEQRPRFHDLRKTGATRVEAVSSHAVAKAFLGHADENVTDTYILATLEAVREAVNRAARLIDGEVSAGVIPFPQHGTFDGKAASSAAQQ